MTAWTGLPAAAALVAAHESDLQSRHIRYMPVYGEQLAAMVQQGRCQVGVGLESLLPDCGRKPTGGCEKRTLGRWVIAVAVNAQSSVRVLTLDEMAKVFAGEVAAFEVYRLPATSPERMIFQTKAMLGRTFLRVSRDGPGLRQHSAESTAELIGGLAQTTERDRVLFGPTRSGGGQTNPNTRYCAVKRHEARLPEPRHHRGWELSLDRLPVALPESRGAKIGARFLRFRHRPGGGGDHQAVRPLAGI